VSDDNAVNAAQEELLRRATIRNVPETPLYQTAGIGGTIEKSQTAFGGLYLSYDVLRLLREKVPSYNIIHSVRHTQIARMSEQWTGKPIDVGWEVVHKDHNRQDVKVPEGFQRLIDEASRYLLEPDPGGEASTTASFLVPLWEDFATINHPCAQVLRNLAGRPVGIRWVDGGIIWPMLEWMRWYEKENPWPGKVPTSFEDRVDAIANRVKRDLQGKRWCLVRDGIPQRTYRDDELIVKPFVNRTDVRWLGYYPGKVESSLEMGLHAFNAIESNGGWFTKGAWVETLLALTGNVSDEDFKRVREDMRLSTQGVQKNQQVPLVRLGETTGDIDLKTIQIKKNPQEMGFQAWISFLFSAQGAIYRMDPSTFNMKPWDGGSNPSLNAPNREKEIALAKEEGLQGDLAHLKRSFLDPFVREIHPDLRLIWHYGDFDPEKENRVNEIRIRVDTTINEIRLEQGRRPLGFCLTDDKYESASDEEKAKHDVNPYNHVQSMAMQSATQQAKAVLQPPEPQPYGEDWQEPDGEPQGQPGALEQEGQPFQKSVRVYVEDL